MKEPVSRLEHCIEFVVRGNPRPELTWLHNNMALRQVDFIRTEYYGQDNVLEGCLLFNKPTHYNNGNYTLVARNIYGVAKQTVYAHFLEQPYPSGKRPSVCVKVQMCLQKKCYKLSDIIFDYSLCLCF